MEIVIKQVSFLESQLSLISSDDIQFLMDQCPIAFINEIIHRATMSTKQYQVLFDLLAKRFDSIIETVNPNFIISEIGQLATVLPQQNQALFDLVVKRCDSVFFGDLSTMFSSSQISELAMYFPKQKDRCVDLFGTYSVENYKKYLKRYASDLEIREIRKYSRILSQACRFNKKEGIDQISDFLLMKIASFYDSTQSDDEKQSLLRSAKYFTRPWSHLVFKKNLEREERLNFYSVRSA